jgi:hypothetical protein
MLLPSRYILKKDADLLCDGRQASIPANTARNLFYIRSGGELLSKNQIATITGTGKKDCSDVSSIDIKKMLQDYFEKEKAEVCFLYQKSRTPACDTTNAVGNQDECSGITEYHSTDSLEPIIEPAIPSNTDEAEEMAQFASMNHHAQGLQDSQDVFLGVAWVLPGEKHLLQLFPYVIHIDCVEDTNNEKRSLFTATGRDSSGTMFTILRAFLPNQCAWVFRWLFQNVFPRMFGKELLSHVTTIITDGDAQETSQLDLAIKLLFPQVFRVRCVWHIVDRGMTKYFPKPLARKNVDLELYNKWDRVRLTVRSWLFSWSDERCETKEEFMLSKALFLDYIQSDTVKEALGTHGFDQLQDFYGKRIEPHEDYFVFYRRRNLFHLDTNSNSAHEGTNNGIKYHSVPVRPTHGLVESTRILTRQSKLKCGDTKVRNAASDTSRSLWSNLPTADHITRLGNSLLSTQWKASHKYIAMGPCNNSWLVMLDPNKKTKKSSSISNEIPEFQRIRTIERDCSTGVLNCSCNYFQRVGIPCRHILCILCSVHGSEFTGISHKDIRVYWWTMYSHFGLSQQTHHKSMMKLLFKLRDNDCQGPIIRDEDMPANIGFEVANHNEILTLSRLPLAERCYNHSPKKCRGVINDRSNENDAPSTLSQDYLNFNDCDDDNSRTLSLSSEEEDEQNEHLLPGEAYELINPSLKTLISIFESTTVTRTDVKELKRNILQLQGKFLERFGKKQRTNPPGTQFVSSNLPDNSRKKTHGTKYMR